MEEHDCERLYQMYGQIIYVHCRRFLRDAHEAEDATQDIFVNAMGALSRIPPGRDALKWLRRVATNVCINKHHVLKRWVLGKDLDESLVTSCYQVRHECGDILEKVIVGAKAPLRAVAEAYYLRELDQEEVAAELRISRRTVIKRIQLFNEYVIRFKRRTGLSSSSSENEVRPWNDT
jgi:RNA polymerase sigma factor (sigma-70 family)